MTKRGLHNSRIALGLSLLALSAGLGMGAYTSLMPTAAHAQIFGDDDKDDPTQPPTNSTVWDVKRLEKLDRNVRKLERSVSRVENTKSPPILIEPDPEVVALQATVDTQSRKQDDMSAALTTARGTIEEQQHQIQVLIAQNTALMAGRHPDQARGPERCAPEGYRRTTGRSAAAAAVDRYGSG